jgi:pimeloyl-ACP methyl ester carboxylesterase
VLRSFADGRLLGAAHGDGRPGVLALPGWMRTHRDFDAVLTGLDAVAVDLPGFGEAAPPPEPWTTAQYAGWVAPVLDEMAVPAVVVGHSFGGRVAVHLALAEPARVGALVLTGVPLVPDPHRAKPRPPLPFRVGRALHRGGLLPEGRMEVLRQRYGSVDYRAARGVMRDVLVKAVNETYAAPLARLECPVALVWGEEDNQAPIGVAEATLALCPGATLTRCAGGHFLPLTAPDCVRDVVLRQQARLRP